MAKNGLNFGISVNLLTENFKKGANSVTNGIRSMQMQFVTFAAALGFSGIGLSNLVSKMIEVARGTSRVTTALKNVSGSLTDYANNLKFVNDLAKKYGIEVNTLTGNFAKFTASATQANMPMEEQKKVFESLSRACSAFGLTASETDGVFLALSQMMGKGKISSEELRKQMGEKLPIAMQAMAKAAGVSIGELEKLLKQGKLMSSEMIPKFAAALNEMIPNVDTDNIESSLARLQNAFGEFVNGSNVQGAYKSLIDKLTALTESLANNLKGIFTGVMSVIAFTVTRGATNIFDSLNAVRKQAVDQTNRDNIEAQAKASSLLEKQKTAVKTLDNSKWRHLTAEGNYKSLVAKRDIQANELEQLKNKYIALSEATNSNAIAVDKAGKAYLRKSRIVSELDLRVAAAQKTTVEADRAYSKAATRAANLTDEYHKAQKNMESTGAATHAVNSMSKIDKATTVLRLGIERLKLAVSSLFRAFWPAAAIAAIVALIGFLKGLYDEAKRVKNVFSDYQKEMENISTPAEAVNLQALQKIINNTNRGIKEREAALSEVAKKLDLVKKKNESDLDYQKRINEAIGERIKLVEAAARAEKAVQEKIKADDRIKEIRKEMNIQDMNPELFETLMGHISTSKASSKEVPASVREKAGAEVSILLQNYFDPLVKEGKEGIKKGYSSFFTELSNQWKVSTDAAKVIENATVQSITSNIAATNNEEEDNKKSKEKSPLQKSEEKYNESLRELQAQLELNKVSGGKIGISQSEYNKSLDELNIKTLVDAKGTGDKALLTSKYLANIEEAVKNPLYNEEQGEFEAIQKKYNEKVKEYSNLLAAGSLTEEEHRNKTQDLITETIDMTAALLGAKAKATEFFNTLQSSQLSSKDREIQQAESDYKKKVEGLNYQLAAKLISEQEYKNELDELTKGVKMLGATILGADYATNGFINSLPAEQKKKYDYREEASSIMSDDKLTPEQKFEALKVSATKSAKDLVSEVENAMSEKDIPLSLALDLGQARREVKDFQKELALSTYDGMKGIMSSADGVVNAFERLTDVFNNVDSSGWDKIMATWGMLTSVVDGFLGIVSAMEKLTEVTDMLGAARTSAAALDSAATATEVANSGTKIAANTTEAATGAAKSVAGIPIAGVAMAIAAVGAIMALFATLPKFAGGGIMQGSSKTGDMNLARINDGEMILNGTQQYNLFRQLNTPGSGQNIIVGGEFRLRGTDLVATIDHTNRKRNRI